MKEEEKKQRKFPILGLMIFYCGLLRAYAQFYIVSDQNGHVLEIMRQVAEKFN